MFCPKRVWKISRRFAPVFLLIPIIYIGFPLCFAQKGPTNSPALRAGNVVNPHNSYSFPLCFAQKGPKVVRRFAPEILLIYMISIGFPVYFAQNGLKIPRRFAPETLPVSMISIGFPLYFAQEMVKIPRCFASEMLYILIGFRMPGCWKISRNPNSGNAISWTHLEKNQKFEKFECENLIFWIHLERNSEIWILENLIVLLLKRIWILD